jgi:hypothetical protein
VTVAAIFVSFRFSWPRDVRSLTSSGSILIARIPSAGADGQTIEQFEADLKNNLYKIWNRMSSGTYFPPPVRAVSIPNPHVRPAQGSLALWYVGSLNRPKWPLSRGSGPSDCSSKPLVSYLDKATIDLETTPLGRHRQQMLP